VSIFIDYLLGLLGQLVDVIADLSGALLAILAIYCT
jgi:hypothetical protein